ncbi:MAG: T9SS type A sorting domain-containing protein [Flavobacteriaceae bacterium]
MIKNTFITGILLLLSIKGLSQTVTTIFEGLPDDALVFDSDGNLYASSYTQGKIYKYDNSYNVSEFTSFPSNAVGIAINSTNEIFNCDFGTSRIRSFLPNGSLNLNLLQSGYPAGIIKDYGSDDLIFTKFSGNSIHRLSTNGSVSLISNAPELDGPVGLTFDNNGELYVSNYNNRKIFRVLSDGTLEYIATLGNSSVLGYIAYAQEMLWGTVLGEHKIYMINPNGIDEVTLFAGSSGGTADGDISVATFAAPNGIIFNDLEDTMYVTEFNTKNIRVISGISLSVEEFDENDIKLLTPLKNNEVILKANIQNVNSFNLTIRQLHGQTVFRETINTENSATIKKINTDSWQDGIYFMTIQSAKNSTTKKFIVKN